MQWLEFAKKKVMDPRLTDMEKKNLQATLGLAAKHDFWDTQPVKKFLSSHAQKDGPIDKSTAVDKV